MSASALIEQLTKCTTSDDAEAIVLKITEEIKEGISKTIPEGTAFEQIMASSSAFESIVKVTLAYAIYGFTEYDKQ